MRSDYYGPPYPFPPYWGAPPQGGGGGGKAPDLFRMMKKWDEYQETKTRKQKESEKKPDLPPPNQLGTFLQLWANYSTYGLVIGLVNLFMLYQLVKLVPIVLRGIAG